MRKNKRSGFRGAPRTAFLAVLCALCALTVCACGGVTAQPTPNQNPSATRLTSSSSSGEDEVIFSSRPAQLAEDMFSGAPDAAQSSKEPSSASSSAAVPEASRETPAEEAEERGVHMRAVWIASVLGIDYPKEPGDPEKLQAEFLEILDNLREWGFDTALVQVRPLGDAFYRSEINPWSSYLTGTQGKDPGWDPLEFMVTEAHDRGISLHAWLNPYRVTHPGSDFTTEDFSEDNIASMHPEWLIEHQGYTYLDPAREEVKAHIAATVKEIVDNYDVDGIHFDDYFYPTEYPLPDGAEKDGIIDQERRANVNDMIRRVKEACDSADHPVVFGISPFGIWKNASTDPAGSDTEGMESYYAMAADSVRWIREELVDYIAPQIYWPVGHRLADYETLAHWWADQVEGTSVSLVVGQGINDKSVAEDIVNELEINAQIPQITGSIFFSYADLAGDPELVSRIRGFYDAAERNEPQASSLEQSE